MRPTLERVRRANPVGLDDPEILSPDGLRARVRASEVVVGGHDRVQSRRGAWARNVAVAIVIVAAAAALIVTGSRPSNMPVAGSEAVHLEPPPRTTTASTWAGADLNVAFDAASRFVDALAAGDAPAALALLAPDLRGGPTDELVRFFAALPGEKEPDNCAPVRPESAHGVLVFCDFVFSGPLVGVVGERRSFGVVLVADGVIVGRPNLGPRVRAERAFVEYASATRPEEFFVACSPESHPARSVHHARQMVFSEACGQLWAEMAMEAARWVQAGRPDVDGRPSDPGAGAGGG